MSNGEPYDFMKYSGSRPEPPYETDNVPRADYDALAAELAAARLMNTGLHNRARSSEDGFVARVAALEAIIRDLPCSRCRSAGGVTPDGRVAALEAALREAIEYVSLDSETPSFLHTHWKRVLAASAPETPAEHTTEEDFEHFLSYSGLGGAFSGTQAIKDDLRKAFYAGADVQPLETPAEPVTSVWHAFDIHTDARIGQVLAKDHIDAIDMLLRMGAKEGGFYVKPYSAPKIPVETGEKYGS
jgi:hypothetical protein